MKITKIECFVLLMPDYSADVKSSAEDTVGILVVELPSDIRRIAFLGDYPPRQCGIATFTADVLSSVADGHPEIQCFAVPVNATASSP